MITRLHIKNFKSWKDTGELRLAPLTGLFGTNSSGKTSILQSLLMLKQTAESPDRKRVLHTGDERSHVDLGTFYDLIHTHDQSLPFNISLSWDLLKKLTIKNPEIMKRKLYEINSLSFFTSIGIESDQALVQSFTYSFDGHEFGMSRQNQAKYKYDLITGDYWATRIQGRAWPLPPPIKCYGFPDESTGYYQNTGFLPDFVLAFEGLLSRIAYLGPLREYPGRSYIWAGERPIDVGRQGEKAVAALLAARADNLKVGYGTGRGRRYYTIERIIGDWLREMGVIQAFSLKPIARNRKDYEFKVKTSLLGSEVLITDVGFGVSQILPVLVLCYYVPEGSIILLEQPEIHLHPSVQADLADVFVDVVKERNVQIILESHSEHLLRRLQRRIAEEKISKDETALYFCKMRNGVSKIEELMVDDYGNINNWPKYFFGDEMGDLVAMTEAAAKRDKKARG